MGKLIICIISFTGIEILSFILLVKFFSLIPWSAAMICGFDVNKTYLIRAVLSVFVTACLSIGFALRIFQKQNL